MLSLGWAFGDAGLTRVEVAVEPQTVATLEALAPTIALVHDS